MAHDDHFHCFDFPKGTKPSAKGSAVRTDTFLRGVPKAKPDLEFYSLTEDLRALETRQNAKLKGSALLDTLGKTAGGRDLHVLKLGARANDMPKKARVLFNAGLHAREWIGPTYLYLLAEWLVDHYPAGAPANDAEKCVKALLDDNHVWFVPMCNPDGHEYTVQLFRFFRKNSPAGDARFIKSPKAAPKRDPAAPPSIDLNRNFDTKQWSTIVKSGTGMFSTDRDDDSFCGTKPAEAEEVKLLQKMIDVTPFDVAVDHHSFSCFMMWPPGDDFIASPADARLQAFINAMRTQINGRAAQKKNETTAGGPDTWKSAQIALFYHSLHGIPKAESVIPGSISDYVHYAALKAKRDCAAFSMELPPMLHPGTPGFDLPEKHIPAVFRQVIATSLGLIANAKNPSPKQSDFDPFDKIV